MSLNWNVTDIADYNELVWLPVPDSVTDEEIDQQCMGGATYRYDEADDGSKTYWQLNPITNMLVWATIEIGIGEITEKNYHEFWMRMAMCDGINGLRVIDVETDDDGVVTKSRRSITLEEVKQHIGLKTNVFPKESTTKFYNKMLKRQQQRRSH